MEKNKEHIRKAIRENYARVAQSGSSGGCCSGSSCCGSSDIQDVSKLMGYEAINLESVPSGSNMGLGCGNPLEYANIRPGETVLDLGSGGGFDCFLASEVTGKNGLVIGVDMTPEMIKLARDNALEGEYENVEFRLGEIEHLPVSDNSVDVIISNCVINLSIDKNQVFADAFRVLKPGGRLAVSDVAATCEMPDEVRNDLRLISGCIGGASHYKELGSMMKKAGFVDIKLIPKSNSKEIVSTWAPGMSPEDYIASFRIEAIKPMQAKEIRERRITSRRRG